MKLSKDHKKLMVVAFFSTFICFFNQTTVNPALPTIIADFGITASTAQWLLSGYLMIMALMIPINAFLVERYSIKSICIFAMGIYTVGCVLTGLGLDFYVTLLGRLFQGAGHGILMPTCMAVMLYVFPIEKRGMILGFFGLLIGFAPILGPTFSGIMVDNVSWHYIYFTVGFFAAICLAGCIFIMPNENLTEVNKSKLDPLSLITSSLGFGLVLYGCAEIGANGFTIIAFATIGAGGLIVAYFFYRQTKIDNPMLEVSVFRSKKFGFSIIVMCICQLAFMGAIVLFPFLIQDVLGYSPTISGLVMIPSSIVMGAMSPLTGKLFDKYGIRWLGLIGMAFLTIAGFCLSCLTEQSPLYMLIIFLCVRNFGASFVLSNVNTWGINDLPTELLAHGNAVSGTFRQIAMSFGAAISTSVYTFVANSLPGGIADPSAGIVGINASFAYQAVLCLIGFVICIF